MRSLALLAVVTAVSVGCLGKTVDAEVDRHAEPAPDGASFETTGPVLALATNASHVCWTTSARGATPVSVVACASKADGRVRELVRDGLVHPWVAMTSGEVFWSTEMTATIERASVAAGAPVPFVTKAGPHGRFVVTGLTAYWLVDGGAGATKLFSAWAGTSDDDAEPTTLVADLGAVDPELLAVDDYSVYAYPIAYTFGGGVVRSRIAAPYPERGPVSRSCSRPADLVVDRRRVLMSCQDGTFHWISMSGDKAPLERVLTGVGWGRIAADGDGRAYVTDYAGGQVRRVDLESGAVDVVATGLKDPTAIAVDDSGVYVSDGTSIRRLAK
jgi:hypothetical protein